MPISAPVFYQNQPSSQPAHASLPTAGIGPLHVHSSAGLTQQVRHVRDEYNWACESRDKCTGIDTFRVICFIESISDCHLQLHTISENLLSMHNDRSSALF